jgi:hypothetical protein
METRSQSRKRKWEEIQNPNPDPESIYEISWHGERLPVELWTKVFYYMLAPIPAKTTLVMTADKIDILQMHPLIAGIINEFLLFRTGVTYADLEDRRKISDSSHYINRGYWIPIPKIRTAWDEDEREWMPLPRYIHNLSIFDISSNIRDGIYYRYDGFWTGFIFFHKDRIHILLRWLFSRNPDKTATGNVKFRAEDIRKIKGANRILPYGLHFRQEGGILYLRMPNNPRVAGPKFRIIRSFPVSQDYIPRSTKLYWGYMVDCTISLNELYIPTWRPYL